ncbi:MAG: hypothetical protein NC543_01480 [bacterium]|nr:hypothetical protein [bacterium]MCM1375133.1 hypothetical protein [Muribaculum sp.]
MRITTQMLNETARKTGVPINSTSLLNHIYNNGSGDSLLTALNKGGNSAADAKQKNNYEKLEKNAGQLQKRADSLAAKGEGSLYAKAKESGNTEEICKELEALAEEYNNTIKALQSAPGPLNDYYCQMLRGAATENSKALAEAGISVSKNGKLTVDGEKLKSADVDTLERVLGASGDFSSKVSFLAGRISDNAEAGIKSLGSQYNSTGGLYTPSGSRYNLRG